MLRWSPIKGTLKDTIRCFSSRKEKKSKGGRHSILYLDSMINSPEHCLG